MKTYKVNITRISYSFQTILLDVNTEQEALSLADDEAGNLDYSEKSAEYEFPDGAVEVSSSYEIETNSFEIWMEGYVVTGNFAEASRVGSSSGVTFDDAVENYIKSNPDHGIEGPKGYWSIWGCKLFDNEIDARKSFG